jgi:hypothetical protein
MEIWKRLLNRMLRAARLDTSLYEQVETEEDATAQAIMIALLASVATSLGMGIAGLLGGHGAMWFLWGLLSGLLASLVGWFAWVLITYFFGTTVFKGPEKDVSFGSLIRTMGFANSPGVVRILCFMPLIGWVITLLVGIWTLAAGVVAVMQTFEFTAGKAMATCFFGWLIYMAVLFLIYWWLPSSFKMLPF